MCGSVRIAIVVNPKARRIRGDRELIGRLIELCRRGEERCRLETQRPARFEVRVSEGLSALPGELSALCEQGVDVLVPCGGDGTVGEVVTALAALAPARWPALCILPAGTMNTVARNLSLTGRPDELLERLLAAIGGPRGLCGIGRFPQEVLELRIQDAELPSAKRVRTGFMFSAAMGARYLHAYASGKRPGLLWAGMLGLRTVGSCLIPGGGSFARWLFAATPAELVLDGEPAASAALRFLICSTVPEVGLGMRVPWQAGAVPGRFHLIASGLSPFENARQLRRMQRGQPLVGTPHVDRLVGGVRLRFEKPEPLTLDGEIFSAASVEVGVGRALSILIPPTRR